MAQSRAAEQALAEPVWIAQTVMLELGWVLNKAIALPRATVCAMLEQVIELETAEVENGEAMYWAIDRFRSGADWADMQHLVASAGHATSFATFDRKLPKQAGPQSPVAVEFATT